MIAERGNLTVVVTSPDEKVWEGQASSVSSENSEGPFDILPQHANFVTMVTDKPIVVRTTTEGENTFSYKNAVISVSGDKVSIYYNI